MRLKALLILAFCLAAIPLTSSSSKAEPQRNVPEHYLRERGVKRIQKSDVYLPIFDRSGARTIHVDFFPDASLTLNLVRTEPLNGSNGFTWYGHVEGAARGTAVFVVQGNMIAGHVTRGDGTVYEVRTTEEGTHWSLEIDQNEFPDERDPLPMPQDSAITSAFQSDEATYADDGSTIDVLVLYTPAARAAAGGTTSMQQLVQLGIAETNQGYANSGVIQRVRLVNTQEISYVESPSMVTDLTRLRTAGDGFLDDALTLRDTYGADLVSLWVESPDSSCGIGYQLSNPNFSVSTLATLGFSVAQRNCATGYYTFGHEMGHNMGAHHAKDDLNSDGSVPVGAYSYSNGYKQPTGINKFRTIMAYDGTCLCPRIDYWSNPNVAYNGLPVGVDPNSPQGAANYLTLNNTRQLVANFRASVITPPPGGTDTTGPLLTITSHTNGQTISSTSIILSGTATDAGRGDNGISSVTVNGVRANGDTATGSGVAGWSRSLTLNNGLNTITIVAKDNNTNQNTTTVTMSINVSTTTSTTANTYHVFPQFANGVLSDGTFYRTTLMVTNPGSSGSTCTFQLYGLTVNGSGTFPFTLPSGGWMISTSISSVESFRSGYATLQCATNVEAQLLYAFYSPAGVKVSEATVFSSPSAQSVEVLSDARESARLGLAIANDSDQNATYAIDVYSSTSTSPIASTRLTLSPRSNRAAFIDELAAVPSGTYGPVTVTSSGGSASVIGLRFTGGAFTTIPQAITSANSATAHAYHIFPQFADGVVNDGSYYRTTIMIDNTGTASPTCSLRLYGLTVNNTSLVNYGTLAPGSYAITTEISSKQSLRSGYATLNCSAPVEAQLLYSYYSASGVKISEATVFSSPSSQSVQVLADNREGARIGLAIANDSDQSNIVYSISVFDITGAQVGTGTLTLGARSARAAFLDELVSLPPAQYGPVYVTSSNGTASVIGLRFNGTAFTTIPETIR